MVPNETPEFTYETKDMKTRIIIHDWMQWMVKLFLNSSLICFIGFIFTDEAVNPERQN